MELKDSILVKMNDSFALGDEGILSYQDRMCALDVDDLRPQFLKRPMVSYIPYIQVPPKCIMILNSSISWMA